LQLFTFIELIMRKWVTFLVITLSVTALAAIFSFLLLVLFPNYETTVVLLITPDAAEAVLAEESGPFKLSDPIRTMLCTYTEIILSWNVCGKVVEKLLTEGIPGVPKSRFKLWYEAHVTPIIKRMIEAWFILNSGEFKGWPTREEALTKELRNGMTVDLTDNTYFLTITLEGNNPKKIFVAAEAIGEVFSEFISNQTDEDLAQVVGRLDAEIERENQLLRVLEDRFVAFRRSQGVVDPEHQTGLIMNRYEDVEASFLETEYGLEELEGEHSGLTSELNELGDLYTKISGAEISPVIASQLSLLASLERELARAELEPDDGRSFERLSSLRQKIEPLRDQIRTGLFEHFSRQLGDAFPSYNNLSRRLADTRTGMFALQAKQKELLGIKSTIETELASIPDVDKTFIELSREISQSLATLRTLRGAKSDAELSRLFNQSNISVIDPPRIPKYPSSPKMALFSIVGFFFGLIIAGVFLLFREFRNGTVMTSGECMDILERPLLASISYRH